VSTAVERNRTYRKRRQALEAIRAELTHMLDQVDPRYARPLVPTTEVRRMFRKLLELAGEAENG
jgi:RNase P protein component